MTLEFDTIIHAIRGSAKILEKNGRLWLYRFTDAQSEAYREYSTDFYKKTKATAGVRLEFITNSEALTLKGEAVAASSRKFFAFDVYVNGSLVSHLLESDEDGSTPYTLTVRLGKGDAKKFAYTSLGARRQI